MNLKQISIIVILTILISTPLFAVLTPDQTKEARRIWLNGYDYFEKGDKALKENQLRQAYTLFEESLKIFENIKAKYPGWSSSMIEYRLKLCRAKKAQVEKILAAKNIKLTDTSVDKENIALKKELATLKTELAQSKRKLMITLTSLENARREATRNTNSSTEMEKIIQEKTELEKRYALLLDRTKKLESTAAIPVVDQKEGNKALDNALLRIEAMTKENKNLVDKLTKEKERFLKVVNSNTQLKYDYKVLQGKNDKIQQEVDKLNGKIAEHNEIIARWEKEKEGLKTALLDTQNELQASKNSEESLKNKLNELRKSSSDDTIIQQLKNENELLSKDLDLVHLQLAKELKAKKDITDSKKILEERLARVEKSVSEAVQEKNKSLSDLDMFRKKMLINDAIVKKQNETIRKQNIENEKLKQDLKAIADKYKNIDKKEREFTELAKESLRVENQNRTLKLELADVKKKLSATTENIKKSEVKMVQMQKDLQDLISQNTKLEKKSIIAQDTLKGKIVDLKKQISNISATLETNKKKNAMLTEELVSANALIEKKDKELAVLTEQLRNIPAVTPASPKSLKEPEIAPLTTEIESLKLENSKLQEELKKKDKALVALRSGIPKKADIPAQPKKADPEKIKKMLQSAFNAEESGKKEAASWYYEKVLTLAPDNNTALTRLGHIEASNGNYDDAIEILKRGLKNDPDDVEKLQVLTVCYIRKNQFFKALATAAKANAISKNDPKTQRYIGIICSNLGWKEAAEKQFRESFKLDPTSAETAFNAAVLLTTDPKRVKDAKLWYEKAVSLGAERDPGIEKIIKTVK